MSSDCEKETPGHNGRGDTEGAWYKRQTRTRSGIDLRREDLRSRHQVSKSVWAQVGVLSRTLSTSVTDHSS